MSALMSAGGRIEPRHSGQIDVLQLMALLAFLNIEGIELRVTRSRFAKKS